MHQYITLGTVRPLGWLTFIGFAAAAVFAIYDGEPWPALGLACFSLGGIYLLVGAYGRYGVDHEHLHAVTPLGWVYRMNWSEVRYVEVGTGGTLVFHGANKRFVLPPVAMWSGEHKPAMWDRLLEALQARGLTPAPSNTADYRWNQNVRVHEA
jgi:hypothetical protein